METTMKRRFTTETQRMFKDLDTDETSIQANRLPTLSYMLSRV